MTARITSRQVDRIKQHAADASRELLKERAQRVIAHPDLQARLKELLLCLAAQFFFLLSDEQAVAWIIKWSGKSEAEARQIVEGFRKKARAHGIADTVKIHAEVQPGGTFTRDLPLVGPCWEDFKYLQGWDFPDPPTEHCLVSWVPAPMADSTVKTVVEQKALIATFKKEAELPAWYQLSFGSVGHVGGLALAHRNATSTDPFNGLVVRTDTCRADGDRLVLHWREGRLDCVCWGGDGGRNSNLAAFAVGVI